MGSAINELRTRTCIRIDRSYLYDCIVAKRAVALVEIQGGEAKKLKAAANAMDEERDDIRLLLRI